MATQAAVLSILVQADGIVQTNRKLHGLHGDLGKAGRAADTMGKNLDTGARKGSRALGALRSGAGLAVGALGAVGLVGAVKSAVGEFEEARKVGALTTQVIKSTGGAAKVSAKEVAELSSAISSKVGIDDEAIQSGANLLLTFKNIRNETGKGRDIFNQATAAAVDLSAAGFGSLESTSKQLGKALNDPVKGMTALGRAGVTFSEDQKKAIEALMETGKAADRVKAQQIILREVQSQVGGAAKSQATSLDHLKVTLGNLAEAAGAFLVPALDKAAQVATRFFDGMMTGQGVGGAVISTFKGIGGAVGDLVTGFQRGEAAARAIAATAAGAAAGFVAFKVGGMIVAGITAVKAAWAGLKGAMATNPLGLALLGASALAGALGILSVKQDEVKVSTKELSDAFRAQGDAMRAVRDIDLDVAQRRANLRTATVNVEQAEKRLSDLRKNDKATVLDVRQAEADLAQAKVSAKRASRDLGDAEEDSRRKREDATTATQAATAKIREHNSTIQASIGEKRKDIAALEDAIGVQRRYGDNTKNTRDNVEALREKQAALRREIDRLESKKITVSVKVNLSPATTAHRQAGADGWGVKDSVQEAVQKGMDTGELLQRLGGLPISGTGLNAFNGVAAMFGLFPGSGFRPGSITSSGNISMHALGRARDFPGPPGAMLAFAQYLAANYGSSLAELIHSPLGFSIKNGQRVPPYAVSDHYDHVHVAMRKGGKVMGSGAGDRIPAMLEPGEFVVQKRIVDRFGPTFFAGLNGMQGGGLAGAFQPSWLQPSALAGGPTLKSMLWALEVMQGALAAAKLSPGTADDLEWLRAIERTLAALVPAAASRGRWDLVNQYAPQLTSTRDEIDAIINPPAPTATGPTEDPNQPLIDALNALAAWEQQRIELDGQVITNQNTLIRLAEKGDAATAAIAAAVSGSIGGRLGLGGIQAVGVPGKVAGL